MSFNSEQALVNEVDFSQSTSLGTQDQTESEKQKKMKRRKAPRQKISYDPTKRRPSREIEIYGRGAQSLLVKSQNL